MMTVEGTTAVYWNRTYYMEFLDECLRAKDNILQQNLFTVLSSIKIIAMYRVYAIFHLSISMPLFWLSGNTHKLHDCDWSLPMIGKSIDLLEEAIITWQYKVSVVSRIDCWSES